MASKWKRIFPNIAQDGQIQAVQAKKHVTVFHRSPSAPGAGNPEVKLAFKACAVQTQREPDRLKRNVTMKACMEAKHLAPGNTPKQSKSKYLRPGEKQLPVSAGG